MKNFNKKSIVRFIKCFLLVSSSMYGFTWNYLFLLGMFTLPINIWTTLLALVLGIASSIGLFHWIERD